jgi:hypothetical protein
VVQANAIARRHIVCVSYADERRPPRPDLGNALSLGAAASQHAARSLHAIGASVVSIASGEGTQPVPGEGLVSQLRRFGIIADSDRVGNAMALGPENPGAAAKGGRSGSHRSVADAACQLIAGGRPTLVDNIVYRLVSHPDRRTDQQQLPWHANLPAR